MKTEKEKKEKKAGRHVEAMPVLPAPCGEAGVEGASVCWVRRKDQTTRAADLHQSALY